MRINYTLGTLAQVGGIRVIFEIASRLAQRGHRVTITHPMNPEDASWFRLKCHLVTARSRWLFQGHLLRRGLRKGMYALTGRNVSNEILRIHYLDRLLSRFIPDCEINVATSWATAFPTVHSRKGIAFYHMQHFEPLFVKGSPSLEALALQTYTLPLNKIANSSWLKGIISREFNEDVPVVCPAIDHQIFYPRGGKRMRKRVVCYGKKTPLKGFQDAMTAMKVVLQKRGDIEWFVYGSEDPSLRDPPCPYHFIKSPTDEELAELYSSADVVICPSWYESFPLPPLEAMACGAPVVTTPLGTEDYAIHEENALVVPPQQPQILAGAILRLLDDQSLSTRLRQAGLETARRFQWEKTVDQLEGLFTEAISHKSIVGV